MILAKYFTMIPFGISGLSHDTDIESVVISVTLKLSGILGAARRKYLMISKKLKRN